MTVPSGIVTSLMYIELAQPPATPDVEVDKTNVLTGMGEVTSVIAEGLGTGVVVGGLDAC